MAPRPPRRSSRVLASDEALEFAPLSTIAIAVTSVVTVGTGSRAPLEVVPDSGRDGHDVEPPPVLGRPFKAATKILPWGSRRMA